MGTGAAFGCGWADDWLGVKRAFLGAFLVHSLTVGVRCTGAAGFGGGVPTPDVDGIRTWRRDESRRGTRGRVRHGLAGLRQL